MSTKATILIVDDDLAVLHFFAKVLQRDGYRVVTASSGESALEQTATQEFDLVLLDLKMKGVSGMEVLASLHRRWPATPVIILTAHASLDTAIRAFRQGAHDYLFKPCAMVDLRESVRTGIIRRQENLQKRDLVARLNQLSDHAPADALTKSSARSTSADEGTFSAVIEQEREQERFIRYKDIIVDPIRHVITLHGKLLDLAVVEFGLLSYLVSQAPRVVSAEELVREVQGYVSTLWEARDIVRSHIYHIRRKANAVVGREVVLTVRGVGYVVEE